MKHLLTAAALALLATPALAASTYTLTDLGTLAGDSGSEATAINAAGQVAGMSYSAGGVRSVLWSGGTATDLGLLPGDSYMTAYGLNDSGQVAGVAYVTGDPVSASGYIYSGGTIAHLANPVGSISGAIAINNAGQAAGTSFDANAIGHVILWSGGTGALLAGLETGSDSYGHGLNDSGQVAGESTVGGDSHPAIFTTGGTTDLGLLTGYTGGYAAAINNNGEAVGQLYDDDGGLTAFLYQNGAMSSLGTMSNVRGLSVNAINDAGAIVGSGRLGSGHDAHDIAILYDGSFHDLSTLVTNIGDWTFQGAAAINAGGQIVGSGVVNGQLRAFLLTPDAVVPVPEPGEWMMLLAGLGVSGWRARRRV